MTAPEICPRCQQAPRTGIQDERVYFKCGSMFTFDGVGYVVTEPKCEAVIHVSDLIAPRVIITASAPQHADKVIFFHRGKMMAYHVWQADGDWYWDGAGNNGRTSTEQEARQSARRWITSGQ